MTVAELFFTILGISLQINEPLQLLFELLNHVSEELNEEQKNELMELLNSNLSTQELLSILEGQSK